VQHRLHVLLTVTLILAPAVSRAQGSVPFAQALAAFANAADGAFGDEGPRVIAAVDAMSSGLTQWNASVRRAEAGLAGEIATAPPPAAAQMLATIGVIYADRRRLDDAVRQLRAAIALDPRNGSARTALADTLERAEAPAAERLAAWRDVWRLEPGGVVAAYSMARLLAPDAVEERAPLIAVLIDQATRDLSAGEPAVVLPSPMLLEDEALTGPLFLPAVYNDAVRLLAASRYDEAIGALRAAVTGDTLTRTAHRKEVIDAIAQLRRGELHAAVTALTPYAAPPDASSEAHRILGMALWADQQLEAAAAELRAAIERDRRNERAYLALSDVRGQADDAAGAEQALRDLVAAVPESGLGHWKLAQLLDASRRDDLALEEYTRAAALPALGGGGFVHAALGRLYYARLDLDRATAEALARVRQQPASAEAHLQLGLAYQRQDRHDAAAIELLLAAILRPADAAARAAAGQSLSALSRDADAERLLRRAVAIDPNAREARYAWATVLARLGRADDSRRELQEFQRVQAAAVEQERRAYALNALKLAAGVQDARRDYPAAVAAWQAVVAQAPNDVEAHGALARALAAAGRDAEAIGEYETAVRLGAGFAVRRALIALYDRAGRARDASAAREELERLKSARMRSLGAVN
jgi:tetratricopeptide (TPR) repeat protein